MAVMASLTVPATATATFLTSVAFVAVMASLTVPAIAMETPSTRAVFVAVTALLVLASVSQSALVQALPAVLLLHGHLC